MPPPSQLRKFKSKSKLSRLNPLGQSRMGKPRRSSWPESPKVEALTALDLGPSSAAYLKKKDHTQSPRYPQSPEQGPEGPRFLCRFSSERVQRNCHYRLPYCSGVPTGRTYPDRFGVEDKAARNRRGCSNSICRVQVINTTVASGPDSTVKLCG